MNTKSSEQKKLPKKITARYLRNAGLFYLQRYAASIHQFKTAMARKIERSCRAHPEQNKDECYILLEELIHEFCELGYLNDKLYLGGMVRSLRHTKGFSKRMVLVKLGQKGFSNEDILTELNKLETEEDTKEPEFEAAQKFAARKKLGPYHPLPPRKTYDQQLSALARAGFSFEICKRIMTMPVEQI